MAALFALVAEIAVTGNFRFAELLSFARKDDYNTFKRF